MVLLLDMRVIYALEAISDPKLQKFKRDVSISWQMKSGPETDTMGERGYTKVPSGGA
eukprot:CAMPEP_0116917372 /NCGR_PEP_ID=MMETSP0467-20121206/19101_1 /TAXON_ID=283647 /ORGANISM="Mesodinium pulex, Strain SPMC105" /LENGTH=56 /DNA_ID=CAMNT_0004594447 /DNA_START=1299 /DNA_END=1469 /DNA_ORIENTATION=+